MGDDQGLKPRLNSIEIKVTLAQGAMERALNKLGLDPRVGLTRRIFFCESQGGLELLEEDHPASSGDGWKGRRLHRQAPPI